MQMKLDKDKMSKKKQEDNEIKKETTDNIRLS